MSAAKARAKINLGLVVGPVRSDGKHEIVTVLQRVALHDEIELEPAPSLEVTGFGEDTIVRAALELLAAESGSSPEWRVHIEKRTPVAAGLGGGSSDAAAALELANATLQTPLDAPALHQVAARVGADVSYFLREGPQLATGDGTELTAIALPADYHVLLVVPDGDVKGSTAEVYEAFDARAGSRGYEGRAASFRAALAGVSAARDLGTLPPNDLASSPISRELVGLGAFRADVSGAGPAVYGLFDSQGAAQAASDALSAPGRAFVTRPVAR